MADWLLNRKIVSASHVLGGLAKKCVYVAWLQKNRGRIVVWLLHWPCLLAPPSKCPALLRRHFDVNLGYWSQLCRLFYQGTNKSIF